MDTKAVQILSRFSFPPNSLHYCGLPSATNTFTNCITTGNCRGVKSQVQKFIVLWPYLKTIADITGLDPFSYDVIEAYWFGNHLLGQITPGHYPILLKNLRSQGVPQFLIDEIKNKVPSKFVPIHLFNILHVGVGKASGSVPFNLDSINNCMLRWGKIIKLDKTHHTTTIKLNSLKIVGQHYKLHLLTETHPYHPDWFTPPLRLGQTAGVHWQLVCKHLTKTEETHLALYTTTLINSIKL